MNLQIFLRRPTFVEYLQTAAFRNAIIVAFLVDPEKNPFGLAPYTIVELFI